MRERVQVLIGGRIYGGYFVRETRIGYVIHLDVTGNNCACAKHQVWRWMRS